MLDERPIRRLLVAARGVEALRILRTAHDLDMEVVGLISATDAEVGWADTLDYAVYVPNSSAPWPDPRRVVEAAADAGCDAIHPGWGPLARDPRLPALALSATLGYVGGSYDRLEAVGDRVAVRNAARTLDLPIVPGTDAVSDAAHALTWLAAAGTPALLKQARPQPGEAPVRIDSLEGALELVEAAMARGPVYLERLVDRARLVEVPVFGDGEGATLAVGDREVTVRFGGQRMLCEAPTPGLDPEERAHIQAMAERLAGAVSWQGLGVVQMLVTPDSRAYILQIRPGLQPWHGATELAYGVDLVDAQIRLTCGEPLGWRPNEITAHGHAISMRVLATDDMPHGASELVLPQQTKGDGGSAATVRVDIALAAGEPVATGDELALVTARGAHRQAALIVARQALSGLSLKGLSTNRELLLRLFDDEDFWRGPVDRDWLDAFAAADASAKA